MKHLKKLSIVLFVAIMFSVSLLQSSALQTYKSGGYTYTFIEDSEVSLYDWDNSSPELIIESVYAGCPITSVYQFAFMNNSYITTLDFSQANNLKKINSSAFYNCSAISNEIILPESLEHLGSSAFQMCTLIPSIKIPENIEEVPSQCFYSCTSLSNVELPETLKTIGNRAFEKCPSLTNIYIPDSVINISDYAFYNSSNVVINCHERTYAHEYAERNNIPYVLVDLPIQYEVGDVNLDGSVDIVDATWIQQYMAEIRVFDEIQLSLADTNNDGDVDVTDATEIQVRLTAK